MAEVSELAELPSETALILYRDTIATFWPAKQQTHITLWQTINNWHSTSTVQQQAMSH